MDYNTKIAEIFPANFTPDLISLSIGGIIGLLLGLLVLFFFNARRSEREKHNKALIDQQKDEIQALTDQMTQANEAAIKNHAENQYAQKQLDEQRETFKKMEEKFTLQFENLANKIFDEKSEKFKTQSQESLNTLLSPLKEKLGDFQKKVDDSFGNQAKEQSALKEHIRMIVESNEKITLQAEGLTKALKGDSKKQGDWGEIVLEKILQDSGLRKDQDYLVQGKGLGIKHVETGAAQKPDVIVYLPEEKHIIIDSKVSLTHYERFCSAEIEDDNDQAEGHLSQFLASVRKHVKDLEKRRYQDTDKLGTPDFVVMFMPIEGAYMLALQRDTDLHQFAWDKGVVLVGPSTLFSTLRTVASLWRLVNQNNNALEIAQQGGALYEKIAGFVDDMKKIGGNLKTLEGNYDNAMKKLSEGRGNILKRTEEMKKLGAKTSKNLPPEMLDQIPNDNKDEAA